MMMENKRTKLNNKGATFVELLVVIAIMVILIGGITAGFAVINNTYAKRAVNNINDFMGTARTKSMTIVAEEWNVEITCLSADNDSYNIKLNRVTVKESEGTTTYVTDVIEEENFSGNMVITYEDNTLGTSYTLDLDHPVKIVFSSGQGSIDDIQVNGISITEEEELGDVGKFTVTSGSYTKEIDVYYLTGKSEIVK